MSLKIRLTLPVIIAGLVSSSVIANQSDDLMGGDTVGIGKCAALADMETGYNKLYQGKQDWLFREADFLESFDMEPEALTALKRINQKLRQDNVTLVLAPIPSRGLLYPENITDEANFNVETARQAYKSWSENLRVQGIQVIDFSKFVERASPELFYKRDTHWTHKGAKAVAKIIGNEVRDLRKDIAFDQAEFTTDYTGLSETDGALQRRFASLCGIKYPYEYKKQFYTSKNEEADLFGDESGLFGDAPQSGSEVVLLGTSFSAKPEYNFPGYLSEALGLEVENHALTGGNVYGSFSQYFTEVYDAQNAPKVIVWEFPINYQDFGKADIYSVMLPQILDTQCKTEVIASQTTLKSGVNTILFNGGDDFKLLAGEDIVYRLAFDSEEVYKIDSTIHFIQGRKLNTTVKRSARLSGAGEFVLDFSYVEKLDGFHFMAMDIDVEDAKLVGKNMTAKVCVTENI